MSRKLIHTAGKVERPEGAGVLTTYDQLRAKAEAFAAGKYILLTICGSSGLGKTTILKQALTGREFGFVKSNAAPFGLYCEAWNHRNKPLLIDDADLLTRTEHGKRLMKALCDTEGWRFVTWQTATLLNKPNAPAPPQFWTNSKVCVLTNEWHLEDGDVHSEAVGDRGMTYVFAPTALEIHRYAATWFWDQEIFDAVAKHLPYIHSPSCRLYYRAWQEKNAGEDWIDVILNQLFTEESTESKVLELMEKPGQDTTKMWKAFVANGYGSRATFYRYFKDLSERYKLKAVENIRVLGKPPRDEPDPMLKEVSRDTVEVVQDAAVDVNDADPRAVQSAPTQPKDQCAVTTPVVPKKRGRPRKEPETASGKPVEQTPRSKKSKSVKLTDNRGDQ